MWVQQNEPQTVERMTQELTARLGRKEDVDKLMASLRKAGLNVGS